MNPTDHPTTRTAFRTSLTAVVVAVAALTAGPLAAAIVDDSGTATARLAPRSQSQASGTATFTAVGTDRIRIAVDLQGLGAGSEHGMHVHETGDCSAADAASAGPHFAMPGQRHGDLGGDGHHAGDLGNIRADADGRARVELTVPTTKLTLAPGPLGVVGRALVVHAKADDLKSQPAGESGGRIACGVIERATVGSGQRPMKPAD